MAAGKSSNALQLIELKTENICDDRQLCTPNYELYSIQLRYRQMERQPTKSTLYPAKVLLRQKLSILR